MRNSDMTLPVASRVSKEQVQTDQLLILYKE